MCERRFAGGRGIVMPRTRDCGRAILYLRYGSERHLRQNGDFAESYEFYPVECICFRVRYLRWPESRAPYLLVVPRQTWWTEGSEPLHSGQTQIVPQTSTTCSSKDEESPKLFRSNNHFCCWIPRELVTFSCASWSKLGCSLSSAPMIILPIALQTKPVISTMQYRRWNALLKTIV